MTEFYIKIEPDAARFDVDVSGTYPKVSVKAPASQGRANEELVKRLSEILGCDARIVSGHRSRRKKIAADASKDRINDKLSDYPG